MSDAVERRISRLEAFQEIRQLGSRYGIAVDSRDIDALVALFVDDGRPVFFRGGAGTSGGKALHDSYCVTQARYTSSQHYMCNHSIDIDDETHARGIVYAIVRQERDGKSFVTPMIYNDRYEKVGGRWLYAERRPVAWQPADWHPSAVGPAALPHGAQGSVSETLPQAFPTWARFWDELARREPK